MERRYFSRSRERFTRRRRNMAQGCLWMVGLVSQEGKKDSSSFRFPDRLFRGLNRYENRINLRQDLRIVKRKHPTPVVRIIVVEDAQASDRLLCTETFAPYVE